MMLKNPDTPKDPGSSKPAPLPNASLTESQATTSAKAQMEKPSESPAISNDEMPATSSTGSPASDTAALHDALDWGTGYKHDLHAHFQRLYGDEIAPSLVERLTDLSERYFPGAHDINPKKNGPKSPETGPEWTEKDTLLITYADMIQPASFDTDAGTDSPRRSDSSPLQLLHRFLSTRLSRRISTVHLLPFFPSSSDDGFSVIDYRMMDRHVGTWEQLTGLSRDFRLMGDLVMNHVSQQSEWFQGYLRGEPVYQNYFVDINPSTNLSSVVRPRSHPLLTPFETVTGKKWLWTTFSEDQLDVNYAEPDVLFEYLEVLLFYLSAGISMVRLDAVAFIWKEPGTACLHHKKTHEIVKLIRTVTDQLAPETTLITETNVPHEENISYFGDGDEAHMVYQFSLSPLLLHALQTGGSAYLQDWLEEVSALPDYALFLNFTASHDGIGVRPVEGLLSGEDVQRMIERVEANGGYVSSRRREDGSLSPYELNITYFDALGDGGDGTMGDGDVGYCDLSDGGDGTMGDGDVGDRDMGGNGVGCSSDPAGGDRFGKNGCGEYGADGEPDHARTHRAPSSDSLSALDQQILKFVCSQAIVLSLKGVPALYFQSLVAGKNDQEGVKRTGRYRSVNRKRWTSEELDRILSERQGAPRRVFDALYGLMGLRREIPAFHPKGKQIVVNLGDTFLSFIRQSPDQHTAVWVVANVTGETLNFTVPEMMSQFTADLASDDGSAPDSEPDPAHATPLRKKHASPSQQPTEMVEVNIIDRITGKMAVRNGQGTISPYQVLWLDLTTSKFHPPQQHIAMR